MRKLRAAAQSIGWLSTVMRCAERDSDRRRLGCRTHHPSDEFMRLSWRQPQRVATADRHAFRPSQSRRIDGLSPSTPHKVEIPSPLDSAGISESPVPR